MRSIPLLAPTIALLLASPALAAAPGAPTLRVSIADLDLNGAHDRAVAMRRIAQAADRLCHDYDNRWSAEEPVVAQCRVAAIRSGSDALAARMPSHSTTAVAKR